MLSENLKKHFVFSVPWSIYLAITLMVDAAHADDNKFLEAQHLYQKQQYSSAMQKFNSAGDCGEREPDRLYYLAMCSLKTSKIAKAESLFRLLCVQFPHSQAAQLAAKYLESDGAAKVSSQKSNMISEIAIPFQRTSKGQITVSVEFAGSAQNMIFDTGADECLVGSNQARVFNQNELAKSEDTVIHTVSGAIHSRPIQTKLRLGTLEKRVTLYVQSADMSYGILGQSFLGAYSFIVDNQAGIIRLFPKDEKHQNKAFDSFTIPFTVNASKMFVNTKLNGYPTQMCFDTGAFGICLNKAQAEELFLKIPENFTEHTKGPDGSLVPSCTTYATVELGPIKKINCQVRVVDSELTYPLLGQNFFRDRSFTIDSQRNEIRFSR